MKKLIILLAILLITMGSYGQTHSVPDSVLTEVWERHTMAHGALKELFPAKFEESALDTSLASGKLKIYRTAGEGEGYMIAKIGTSDFILLGVGNNELKFREVDLGSGKTLTVIGSIRREDLPIPIKRLIAKLKR